MARGDFALTSDALVLAVRDNLSSAGANATPTQDLGAGGGGGDAGEIVAVVELCLRQPEGFLPFNGLFDVRIRSMLIFVDGILMTVVSYQYLACGGYCCYSPPLRKVKTPLSSLLPRARLKRCIATATYARPLITTVPPRDPPSSESRKWGGNRTCATLPLLRSTEGTDTESSWCFFVRTWRWPIGGKWWEKGE